MNSHPKILPFHLSRDPYVYVRQSTLNQVLYNGVSTERQYALADRACQLGWGAEQVVIIDEDQGQSAASSAHRAGFQQLISAISLEQVGIVLVLEVSRLASSCSDWYRVLELAALSGTLIGDEAGIYDPRDYNDRLLLGLKGTLSEAELYTAARAWPTVRGWETSSRRRMPRSEKSSKANHLTYLGDAAIGRDVNIGAGAITCNYDGANKHHTVIEDQAFIGSDTALVAPVTVGRGATIGAGSTITKDAPPDQLTVARSKQVTVPGWKKPQKKRKE